MVDGMAALENGHLTCGLEEIRKADWAVLPHGILHARVRLSDLVRVATPARIAVKVVLTAAYSAYSALPAVENLFVMPFVIPELA
mmetsp:Transcript_45400/g.82997  ORF Transcript_45400/g.82997 Transcript_45400/m.82997 type:complete len:85 (-) Transcript_45400:406-660(-)